MARSRCHSERNGGCNTSAHASYERQAILVTVLERRRQKQYVIWNVQTPVYRAPDVLIKEDGNLMMVIRDQKTRMQTGHYKCKIPGSVSPLMEFWVSTLCEEGKRTCNVEHDRVFFNTVSGKPFSQQAFSKYAASAFKEVTGHDLNLQIMRRILPEGEFKPHLQYSTPSFL